MVYDEGGAILMELSRGYTNLIQGAWTDNPRSDRPSDSVICRLRISVRLKNCNVPGLGPSLGNVYYELQLACRTQRAAQIRVSDFAPFPYLGPGPAHDRLMCSTYPLVLPV